MNPEKYTIAFHAKRVLAMLNTKTPCCGCPANKDFRTPSTIIKGIEGEGMFSRVNPQVCKICQDFSEVPENTEWLFRGCPCLILGPQENIKRAWIKLEEMGLI